MSSETSTRPQPFRPFHFFVLGGLIAATAAVLLARDSSAAHLILLSAAVGAAALAAFALHRTLLPLAADSQLVDPEPLAHRAREALEREKTLVLRSIKELEFDRAMGKVSEADFHDIAARLRARAIALMQQLDHGSPYRDLIERELAARRAAMRAGAPAIAGPAPALDGADAPGDDDLPDAAGEAAPVAGAPACAACGTPNDADALFCKQCGSRLAA
jgi:hypothetical protein